MNGDEWFVCARARPCFLGAGRAGFCHWVAFGDFVPNDMFRESLEGVAILLRKQEDRVRCFATSTNYHKHRLVIDRDFEKPTDQHMLLLQCQLNLTE